MHPGGTFGFHDFKNNKPFKITNTIDVIGTPGHTDLDLSVIVRETDEGTVAITGDLFINADDIEEEEIWRSNSTYPELQEEHRNKILKECDVIIPGHGPAFRVDEFELVQDDSPTQQRNNVQQQQSSGIVRQPATNGGKSKNYGKFLKIVYFWTLFFTRVLCVSNLARANRV